MPNIENVAPVPVPMPPKRPKSPKSPLHDRHAEESDSMGLPPAKGNKSAADSDSMGLPENKTGHGSDSMAGMAEARKSMLKRQGTERGDLHNSHADAIGKMNKRHETEHKSMADQQAEKYNADVDAQNAAAAPVPPTSPTNTADDPTRYSRGR